MVKEHGDFLAPHSVLQTLQSPSDSTIIVGAASGEIGFPEA
jgi:hypothetical protein